MKILDLLKRLIPHRGPKEISAKEGRKRLKDMKERIELDRKRNKNTTNNTG